MRHFNIPIFIPELACPFRCVYCNQYNITGNCHAPDRDQVIKTIDEHLATFSEVSKRVEVAFFGGSFTGLKMDDQNKYLKLVQPYLKRNQVQGIRISTRPDYITREILLNLKDHGVVAIELGAQSMDEEVLMKSGRGHNANDIENAAQLIKIMGFELGLQMMTGLPYDTNEKALQTAQKIISLGADNTRIYPTLVIKDTPLADMYHKGEYQPQNKEEAIDLCARLFEMFCLANVKVLRMGLHPAEGFLSGNTLVAGPFHQAFGELVMTKVWQNRFSSHPGFSAGKSLEVLVHPTELNAAIGHKAQNKTLLKKFYPEVHFVVDESISKGKYHVNLYR